MAGRIDYDIEKYQFTEAGETPRLREQWREVYLECRQLRAGAEERLRIALLNVDYVTSFELPFRLLLVRAPQLIADVRETLQLSRKAAVFNGRQNFVPGVSDCSIALDIGIDQPMQVSIVLFQLFQVSIGLVAGKHCRKHKRGMVQKIILLPN